jgi:hypothetical protein
MRTTTHLHRIITALVLTALAADCGGGDAPTAPETAQPSAPERTTLILDFANIEVIEDCDGIEGDGDFQFQVYSGQLPLPSLVFNQSVSLAPGAKTWILGRRSYAFEKTDRVEVIVNFTAWEWDRDIFGGVYADERLAPAAGEVSHLLSNGGWSRLGTQSVTLGRSGCLVRLFWTATAQ